LVPYPALPRLDDQLLQLDRRHARDAISQVIAVVPVPSSALEENASVVAART
jgi:hypothetical protein